MLLGCFIATVHYVQYAYRFWCGCWHPKPLKTSSSVLSIASYFKPPHKVNPTQPHPISQSSTSLQHQTVIIAHPTTHHYPMTVLYGQCIDSTRIDKPPPYSIVVPGRLSHGKVSTNSLENDLQSIVGWDNFKQSLQNVQGFAHERHYRWDSRFPVKKNGIDSLGMRLGSFGNLNEERRFSAYAWDDHISSTTNIDESKCRTLPNNPPHDSSLCQVHDYASHGFRRQSTAPSLNEYGLIAGASSSVSQCDFPEST